MKSTIIICSLAFIVGFVYTLPFGSQSSGKLDCVQELKNLNYTLIKALFLFDPEIIHYEDSNDFQVRYCDLFPDYYRQVLQYKKCLTPFLRTLFAFIMRNIKGIYNEYCLVEEKRELAVRHLKCMDSETKPEILDIKNILYDVIMYVHRLKDLDEIIPAACCAVKEGIRETEVRIKRICHGKGLPDTPQFALQLIQIVISDAFDMMCGKYPSVEVCWELQPKLMKGIVGTINSNHTEVGYDVFFLPVLEILKRLDKDFNIQE